MIAAPGTLPWLLHHELRVAWREARFFAARGRSLLRPLLLLLVLQLLVLPAGWLVAHMSAPPAPVVMVLVSIMLAVAWSAMMAQALVTAAQVLYLRGDLDLLLASPISPRAVLTVRALAVALNAITGWTVLVMLLVNALVLFGQFRWLALYPVIAGLALSASAAALVLASALFTLLGPRRMRIAAQTFAAVVGLAVVFIAQVPGLISGPGGTRLPAQAGEDAAGVLWWPARAALGEPEPMIGLLLAALALFALTVAALGPRFAAQAAAAVSAGTAAPARASRRGGHFRGGERTALLRKEWRLLRRDPWLLSQILLQALYLLPLGVTMWHGGASSVATDSGLALVIVVIAGALTGGLAWITIAGEDAPELLACAPIPAGLVARAKLVAALVPAAALLSVALAALALRSPLQALVACAGCAGAMLSAALLQLWHPQSGRRGQFNYRHRASLVRSLFELGTNMGWGFATALTLVAPSVALVLWGLALAILPMLYVLRWRSGASNGSP
jgi:ABC-2 type transport system permease protein